MIDQPLPAERTASRQSGQSATRTRPVILAIEDSDDDFFLLQRAFNKLGAVTELAHVENGLEALKYLARAKENPSLLPALLLLDLKLPGMSGLELLSTVRKDPVFRPMVVNILTSSAEPSDIEQAFALGANAYTVKPMGLAQYEELVDGLYKFWFQLCQLPALAGSKT